MRSDDVAELVADGVAALGITGYDLFRREYNHFWIDNMGTAMDPEVLAFQDWFRAQGNQPLTGVERSILKTYIGWKLLYEEGSRDPQA